MADYENFESTGEPNVEEDPAADFLAREQTELAGLEDESFTIEESSQPSEATAGNGFNAFEESTAASDVPSEDAPQVSVETDLIEPAPEVEPETEPEPSQPSLFETEEPPQVDLGSLAPEVDLDQPNVDLGSLAPEVDLDQLNVVATGSVPTEVDLSEPSVVATGSVPTEVDLSEPSTNGPTDGGGYAAIAQADKHRQEPEKIRIWREEQKKRLEQKDAEEEVKNSQWRDAAKKELEDWLKHHAEQLVKTKENNRAAAAAELAEITCGHTAEIGSEQAQEEASNKDRDETIAGQEWEKICRLCDFNPKHSKNTKDVSRMRSILLQLKQTPLVR